MIHRPEREEHLQLRLAGLATAWLGLEPRQTYVFVERERFLAAWRRSKVPTQVHLARGDERVWRSDSRFAGARDGFSRGRDNPVPPGTVSFSPPAAQPRKGRSLRAFLRPRVQERPEARGAVSFVNGVNRTIWLLEQGAAVIPLHCDSADQAQAIEDLAGAAADRVAALVTIVAVPRYPWGDDPAGPLA